MTEQDRFTAGRGEHPGSGEPLSPAEQPDSSSADSGSADSGSADSGSPDSATAASASSDRALLRLETRLARAEAQIIGLQDSMADVHAYFRAAKQRSLYLRIGLLLAALAAFLYLRYVTTPG